MSHQTKMHKGHGHNNNNNNQNANNGPQEEMVEVYAPDTKTLYTVPRSGISHAGAGTSAADQGKNRLLVCRSYCNAIEAGERPSEITACAMGNQCRFVHIDVPLSKLKGDIIHVHYVYRDESLCAYDSLSVSVLRENPTLDKETVDNTCLMIYGPNNREPVERIPASRLLLTGGSRYAYECSTNPRRNTNGQFADQPRVCHCAHYYFTQTCNRGSNCSFIHVISVDPSQKVDSSKPANYRRRVAQLGQPEVPQINAMSPQVNYHTTPLGTPQSSPMTTGHFNGRNGNSASATPNFSAQRPHSQQSSPLSYPHQNGGAARVPRTAPRVAGSPYVAEQQATSGFDSYNNSSVSANVPTGASAFTSANTSSAPTHQGSNGWNSKDEVNFTMPTTPSRRPYNPYPPATGNNGPYTNGTPTVQTKSTASPTTVPAPPMPPNMSPSRIAHPNPPMSGNNNGNLVGTSMLPMDDVVESMGNMTLGVGISSTHSGPQQYNASTAGPYHSSNNFSLNNNAGGDNYFQDKRYNPTSPDTFSPTGQPQYANSNRASPMGTPSTAMHRGIGTPKTGPGRFAHNPYAQSPVTMQAQV